MLSNAKRAVEADRNTMPAFRSNLHETSFLKKILSYRDIRHNELYKTHFSVSNLMVLTVTTNETHLQHIKDLIAKITGGSKMFCFRTMPSLARRHGEGPCPSGRHADEALGTRWPPDFYIDKE